MRYEVRLTNGVTTIIETSAGIGGVVRTFEEEHWQRDIHGWWLNPAQVVCVRGEEADGEPQH